MLDTDKSGKITVAEFFFFFFIIVILIIKVQSVVLWGSGARGSVEGDV